VPCRRWRGGQLAAHRQSGGGVASCKREVGKIDATRASAENAFIWPRGEDPEEARVFATRIDMSVEG